jgi:hypothetical protein
MSVRHLTAVAAVLTILAGISPLAVADATSFPFRATLTGHAGPQPTADPCVLSNTEGGSGVATHLGAVDWTSAETVNFCTNLEGADVEGTFVWTAANGDEIRGRYVTVAHPDFAAGTITFAGTWEVTSGTGRFAGATGEGTLSGHGSLAPPFEVAATFEGAIRY